eukprot:9503819-Pyramimonas_sp.AAC.1
MTARTFASNSFALSSGFFSMVCLSSFSSSSSSTSFNKTGSHKSKGALPSNAETPAITQRVSTEMAAQVVVKPLVCSAVANLGNTVSAMSGRASIVACVLANCHAACR